MKPRFNPKPTRLHKPCCSKVSNDATSNPNSYLGVSMNWPCLIPPATSYPSVHSAPNCSFTVPKTCSSGALGITSYAFVLGVERWLCYVAPPVQQVGGRLFLTRPASDTCVSVLYSFFLQNPKCPSLSPPELKFYISSWPTSKYASFPF